jgi:hypothetical protein
MVRVNMPRNVIFVAPFPTDATMRFVRAAASLDDIRLLGIVHTPPPRHQEIYADIVRVTEPHSLQDVLDGIDVLRKRHGEPFRIIGILEAMMVLLAQARERYDVPGTPVSTAELFREKARMKDALRAGGLPVARHKLITCDADAEAFAEEVGYPIILKPPAGMGAKATFRVVALDAFLRAVRNARVSPDSPMLAEEMLSGQEYSMETITIGGVPVTTSFSHYLPGCLEVLENDWIQWACLLPREIDGPVFDRARQMGVSAIRTLGLQDGMTHMEWFEREGGSLAIGEIAQRPPGPQLCMMTGLVHDIDIYRAWARAVVDGELDAPWERKYAAGCAFVRGSGHGRVIAVTGVRETHEAIAPWLVEAKLPTIGAHKNDSYEGDGYVVVRHESTEKVKELITTIVQTMKVHYTG